MGKVKVYWPAFRYGPNLVKNPHTGEMEHEAAIFASQKDVPAGWQDHPKKFEKAAPTQKEPEDNGIPPIPEGVKREHIVEQLKARQIDHHGNASNVALWTTLYNSLTDEEKAALPK